MAPSPRSFRGLRNESLAFLRWRYLYLLAIALFTVFCALQLRDLEIDHGSEALNARSRQQLRIYPHFKQVFGDDEEFLLTVTREDLLSPQGLRTLASISSRIAALGSVERVYSLANASQIISGPSGAESVPLTPIDGTPQKPAYASSPESFRHSIEEALDRNPHLTGLLISADRSTAAILIQPDSQSVASPNGLITALRGIVAESESAETELHLTGIALQKHDVAVQVRRDELLLLPVSLVVIALVLALSFGRFSGVFLPLLVTVVSLAATLGCYSLAGLKLNPITSLLAPAVTVLSISTSVHIYYAWIHSTTRDPLRRLAQIVVKLRAPCFVAALTTAFGFGSLALSDIPAIRYFGTFAAFGVMLSFLVGITLTPAALSFLTPPSPAVPGSQAPLGRLLEPMLRGVARICRNRPRDILKIAALLAIISAAGVPQIRNNTDLIRFLRNDSRLRVDTLFVDRSLTGPNNLELTVARRDHAPLNAADFITLDEFAKSLHGDPAITGVWSLLPLLKQLHRAESGATTLALPADDDSLAAYLEILESSDEVEMLRRLLSPDHVTARLRVSVHVAGTAQAARIVRRVRSSARATLGNTYKLIATGSFYQVARDSNRLVATQIKSFALAFALAFGTIGVLFRSRRLMFVAVVPNLLPVLWTAGMMGYAGVELSSGTVMIASVVIGIAVDDTVHYLMNFLRERGGGESAAIEATTTRIGAALVVSSLVLASGFWVGCLGSFQPTVQFSFLAGLSMLTALLCDLFVLPALLIVTGPRRPPA